MLDINFIREHPEELRKALTDRQMDSSVVDKLLTMDAERRGLLVKVENLKALRNTVSKEISQTKDPAERQEKIDAMRSVGEEIAQLD
ncbi:MAG TPA: serine--tRNA ligase, partial [Anaerolineaceae bacterium]|nr:serine--tRNA ligase [Anaerolineaceae bacterium]